MKACGLVVEYNPFHHGHLYHLEKAKQISSSDLTIAIMSGSFLQRGEPAMIDKFHRTKAALDQGVDIVLELPYAYAVQSSQLFAKGAILTLDAIGVDAVCFGSEVGEIDPLIEHLQFMKKHEAQFDAALQAHLQEGMSYPKAASLAYEKIGLHKHPITSPNNILGFHYIKTILEENISMQPYTIKRIANDYHDKNIHGAIASATSIRTSLLANKDTKQISHTLPDASLQSIEDYLDLTNTLHDWEAYFPFLYYKIRTSKVSELSQIHLMEEGLENRVIKQINKAHSFSSLLEHLNTNRYTNARLQRALTHLLTNTSKEEIEVFLNQSLPYVRLLGMNKQGQAYLQEKKKEIKLPILSKLNRKTANSLQIEERASKTYYSIFQPALAEKLFKQELQLPIRV